jgi:uncharacterized phiE125 gp8 family phage protein
VEPVSLEDIKRHLVLDPADTGEDAYLTSMLVAARRACELRINRTVVGEDRTIVLRAFPASAAIVLTALGATPLTVPVAGAGEIELVGGSVTAATVRYYDAAGADQVLSSTAYFAALGRTPALLEPKADWPAAQARPDAVRVTYTLSPLAAGDLDMVRHAIRLIVGNWYANREGTAVDVRGTPAELPLAVTWLLEPLRAWPTT